MGLEYFTRSFPNTTGEFIHTEGKLIKDAKEERRKIKES